jgi:hypothetical protein
MHNPEKSSKEQSRGEKHPTGNSHAQQRNKPFKYIHYRKNKQSKEIVETENGHTQQRNKSFK